MPSKPRPRFQVQQRQHGRNALNQSAGSDTRRIARGDKPPELTAEQNAARKRSRALL